MPKKKSGKAKRKGKTPVYDVDVASLLGCKSLSPDIREMRLEEKGLNSFPQQVLDFSSLTSLNLNGNKISSLPNILTQISRLKRFSMSSNELTKIPGSINDFRRLQKLCLDDNKIKNITKFPRLVCLLNLSLNNNQLDYLPDEIASLTGLQVLSLAGNNIYYLPKELSRMKKLKEINIARNQFTDLHDWILEHSSLRILQADGNHISIIPPKIENLKELVHLNLSENQISSIPHNIRGLSSLVNLNLGRNRIIELPSPLSVLTRLTCLDITKNPVSEIPCWIDRLSKLVNFYITGTMIRRIPDVIGTLVKLKSLGLSRENKIAYWDIPRNIKGLLVHDYESKRMRGQLYTPVYELLQEVYKKQARRKAKRSRIKTKKNAEYEVIRLSRRISKVESQYGVIRKKLNKSTTHHSNLAELHSVEELPETEEPNAGIREEHSKSHEQSQSIRDSRNHLEIELIYSRLEELEKTMRELHELLRKKVPEETGESALNELRRDLRIIQEQLREKNVAPETLQNKYDELSGENQSLLREAGNLSGADRPVARQSLHILQSNQKGENHIISPKEVNKDESHPFSRKTVNADSTMQTPESNSQTHAPQPLSHEAEVKMDPKEVPSLSAHITPSASSATTYTPTGEQFKTSTESAAGRPDNPANYQSRQTNMLGYIFGNTPSSSVSGSPSPPKFVVGAPAPNYSTEPANARPTGNWQQAGLATITAPTTGRSYEAEPGGNPENYTPYVTAFMSQTYQPYDHFHSSHLHNALMYGQQCYNAEAMVVMTSQNHLYHQLLLNRIATYHAHRLAQLHAYSTLQHQITHLTQRYERLLREGFSLQPSPPTHHGTSNSSEQTDFVGPGNLQESTQAVQSVPGTMADSQTENPVLSVDVAAHDSQPSEQPATQKSNSGGLEISIRFK